MAVSDRAVSGVTGAGVTGTGVTGADEFVWLEVCCAACSGCAAWSVDVSSRVSGRELVSGCLSVPSFVMIIQSFNHRLLHGWLREVAV